MKIYKRQLIFSGLVYHRVFRVIIAFSCIISCIIACAILSWHINFLNQKKSEFSVLTMVDVGQGDGFVIDMQGGQKVYIDVGENYQRFKNNKYGSKDARKKMSELQPVFKFENIMRQIFGRNTVDIIFLTHDDADHAGAVVELSSDERIGAYGLSPYKYTYIDKLFKKAESKNDTPNRFNFMTKGIDIDFGDNSSLKILHPVSQKVSAKKSSTQSVNNSKLDIDARASNSESLVMKYNFAGTSVLFTGDIGFKEEAQLLSDIELYSSNYLRSDILKVGHHGSKGSTDSDFLKSVNPNFALISAGFKNRYGHPHISVIRRLTKNDQVLTQNIYRTDVCGTIKFYLYKNGAVGRRDCDLSK